MKMSDRLKIGFVLFLICGQLIAIYADKDIYPFVRYRMFSTASGPSKATYAYNKVSFYKKDGTMFDEFQLHGKNPFTPYNVRSMEALLGRKTEMETELVGERVTQVLRKRHSGLVKMQITQKVCLCGREGLRCEDLKVYSYGI